jgi:hypothetical protein
VNRRLINFLAALSLLLCVAAIGLWARSYFRSDAVWYSRVAEGETFIVFKGWQLETARGDVSVRRQFSRVRHGGARLGNVWPNGWAWQANAPADRVFMALGALTPFERGTRTVGFEYYSAKYDGADGSSSGHQRIVVPAWALVLLTAPLPTVRLWRRLRRRRFAPGHCRGCGYDLRGNESGVCPECGQAAAPA